MKLYRIFSIVLALPMCGSMTPALHGSDRPNIFFAIADDWGWPHSGSYGDAVVQTPTFDGIAANGVLFTNAYIPLLPARLRETQFSRVNTFGG